MIEQGHLPDSIFGLEPLWVATGIFFLAYSLIMVEKFNRAVIAMLAGSAMLLLGLVDQGSALSGEDLNVLGLLIGMMVIVAITSRSGVFQFLAIWSAKKVKAKPWGMLVMLSIITAVLSAALDNVTTVLLIVPVTLAITREMKIEPYPFLFAEILFSNIGGTATLIGDPPNILIGSQVPHITFNDFLVHVAPIVPVIMVATFLPLWLVWGKRLSVSKEAQERVLAMDERECLQRPALLKKSLTVLTGVLIGFAIAHPLGIETATVALCGAAILLLLDNLGRKREDKAHNVHASFGEVEWVTIFFFVGLFVMVHGLQNAGALGLIADQVVQLTEGAKSTSEIASTLALAVMWVSAIASAIVDNIPFVATMIPTLQTAMDQIGVLSAAQQDAIWWSLSLGACLGGNGSLIGASANLITAGIAERQGHAIPFLKFLLNAFPLMLMSVAIASVYVWFRYLN
ncbi:MAG TPA: hypothetical protein DDW23_01135 [Planctomycetes bacterium]|nr:hypothetical protein [Planctomycetota bacterium]